jgi:hypothetical protein
LFSWGFVEISGADRFGEFSLVLLGGVEVFLVVVVFLQSGSLFILLFSFLPLSQLFFRFFKQLRFKHLCRFFIIFNDYLLEINFQFIFFYSSLPHRFILYVLLELANKMLPILPVKCTASLAIL